MTIFYFTVSIETVQIHSKSLVKMFFCCCCCHSHHHCCCCFCYLLSSISTDDEIHNGSPDLGYALVSSFHLTFSLLGKAKCMK